MSAQLLPVLWRSAKVTWRTFWRAARQLLHEAAGTLFALFALDGAWVAWRQWKYHPVGWVIALTAVYSLMMAVFAFTSFRRARRVR